MPAALRSSGERLAASIRGLALLLRDRAHAESRRRRIAWGLIALFMVLTPVVFTLARDSGFKSSQEIFPTVVKPYPPQRAPGYYQALLKDPELQRQMRLNVHAGVSEYRDARVGSASPNGALVLTVPADDPARARELVIALGPQLVVASRREVARRAGKDAAALRARLRAGHLDRRSGRSIRRRLAQVERLLPNPPDPAVLGPPEPQPRLRSWADRVADALPGEFPARPSPVAAGLAGLLIAATLWTVGLALVPPGRVWGGLRVSLRGPAPRPTVPDVAIAPDRGPAVTPAARLPDWRRAAWIAALFVAPIVTLSSIATNAVNVPFNDEWTLVSLFQAAHNGTLDFAAFWAQHHEHRPLIPRAADFGLAYVTGWDIRVELYVDFAVAVATFLAILAALRRTLDRGAFLVASVVTSVIFFSPVQWENWLWGWQLEWFLCNLMAVGAIWALTVVLDRSPRRGLRLGAAFAFVGTFSLGQGLILWPLGLALLVLRRRPWRTWAVLSVATFALYFADWTNPGDHPSKTVFISHPLQFLEWICLYLGRTFAVSTNTGVAVGVVLILSFVAAAVYVFRRREDSELVARAEFWLAIGVYALGADVITAVSRQGFGLLGAAVPRYSGMAALFAIATMAVLFTILRGERIAGRVMTVSARRWGAAAVAVPLLVIAVVNTRHGLDDMKTWHQQKGAILACARQARAADDPCLDQPPLNGGRLPFDQIEFTRARGWAGF